MSIKKNIIRFAQGISWRLVGGERKNVQSLDEGLEHLADCGCGIKCCPGKEAIRIPAQDSQIVYELYAVGGQLVLKNTADGSTTNVVALPTV